MNDPNAKNEEEPSFEYFHLFDVSMYSLKVHSCTSIKGINPDELIGGSEDDNTDEGSTDEHAKWENKTTAVINYRLCPTDACQDDTWQGCRNDYGDYVVSVKRFLKSKQNAKEYKNQNEELCQKCDWCAWVYSTLCDIYDECQTLSCGGEEEDEGSKDENKEEEIE